MSMNENVLRWLNIVVFICMVIVNGLAGSTDIIGGVRTAEISDSNPTLVTPAGYVFSIWGIIYILLAVFVIYQALPGQKGKEFHARISWLFVLSSIFNMIWLFLWQYELLAASLILMIFLLLSLIAIYLRLDIGRSAAPMKERLAVHLPFSVYLGWITIATIANVSVLLVSLGWDGFGISETAWASLIIVVALVLTLAVVATRKDVAYGLVVVWALVGIAAKQSAYQDVVTIAIVCAVIVLIALAIFLLMPKIRRKAASSA